MTVTAMALTSNLCAANAPWPFPERGDGAQAFRADGAWGVYNARVGLLFRVDDGVLLGIWSKPQARLVAQDPALPGQRSALWSLETMPAAADAPVGVSLARAERVLLSCAEREGVQTLTVRHEGVACGPSVADVTLRASLGPDDERPRWSCGVHLRDRLSSVWSVTYPRLAAPAPADGEAGANRLVIPYRRGVLRTFGKAVPGTGFDMPYELVAGPFLGDWWDAARIYRAWWVRQEWASEGRIAERRDLPDWLKRTPVVLRLSTTQPARTVSNNVSNALALAQAFGGRPILGVWYGPFDAGDQEEGLEKSGHGHALPLRPGVAEALHVLREGGVHVQSYIQSIIYDPTFFEHPDPAEAAQADAAVCRAPDGSPSYYTKPLYAMCRATDWWQARLQALGAEAVRAGFAGVYLDSFGKGGPDCFNPDHGHPLGGGDTVIRGQRRLAQRLRDAAREVNPEAVFSGEAPVECFRDLLGINLYAVNRYHGYVPVMRAIWGDYGLAYGRTMRFVPKPATCSPRRPRCSSKARRWGGSSARGRATNCCGRSAPQTWNS